MNQTAPNTKEKSAKKRSFLLALPVLAMAALTIVSFLHAPADASPVMTQASARKARIVTYVQDAADMPDLQALSGKVDQINYAFALLEDGKATLNHTQGLKDMSRFLRSNPHIDGVLSVGGWGADGFSQACATEEGRVALAESILALVDQYGFVGVDIDWEYPGMSTSGIDASAKDEENWYALLTLLRQGLDARQAETGRDHLLSVALGASAAHVQAADGARLAEIVDQAVVMAYDLRGFDRLTGHHAGLYPDGKTELSAAWAVNAWAEDGIPEAKLLLGVPMYGRVWRQVSGGNGLNRHAATSGNRVVTQKDVAFLLQNGADRFWDEKAQAAHLYDGENFVSYEDAESLHAKADWAVEKGLLGLAAWCVNQDEEGLMIAAMHEALEIEVATETDLATPADLATPTEMLESVG